MKQSTILTPEEKIRAYSIYGFSSLHTPDTDFVLNIYYNKFSTFTLYRFYRADVLLGYATAAGTVDMELERRHPHLWPIIRRFIK